MSRRMISLRCQHCGSSYAARPDHSERSKFCSRSCRSTSTANRTAESRGDQQRGRGEGLTYIKRGGRHEHRRVAEEAAGRLIMPGEVVHHIDGNRRNNDPSNLKIMTQAEHMREHGLGIPGVAPACVRRRQEQA